MMQRREFLKVAGLGFASGTLIGLDPAGLWGAEAGAAKKKMAIISTEWRYHSHVWHMGERFLVGYPKEGKWHKPAIEVVSAYIDQHPKGDLSYAREKEFGFKLYPTIAEALRCGGEKMVVDCVLIIGEHGEYPYNKYGQHLYPRYEFFKQVVEVYKKDGKTAPIFNDKHLSWNFDYAKEMVETSKEMKFPLLAGSSLPVTWRMPSIDLPYGAEVEEAMVLGMGGIDVYDFHNLEAVQSFIERRKGGETGVAAVQAIKGENVWKAMAAGNWQAGGWNPKLFEGCLSRSQTLTQPETYSDRYPTVAQMKEWVKEPIAYRIEYVDGTKLTLLLMNGLVNDMNVAAKIKGVEEPLSTLYYLPPNPNVVYSAALMSGAEEMFMTGKAPYPAERTMLTSGVIQSCVQSLFHEQKRMETPHLAKVKYEAPDRTLFYHS